MTDKTRTFLTENSNTDEVAIEKLIRLGGQQEQIEPERAERVRKHLYKVWQQRLQQENQHKSSQWLLNSLFKFRGRWIPAGMIAMLCLTMGTFWVFNASLTSLGQNNLQPLAWIESLEGEVLNGQTPAYVSMAVLADADIQTQESSVLSLRLADGSRLKIDRSSQVTFLNDHQIKLLAGAVYYDSQNTGSILIHTPRGRVSNLGTRFETRLIQSDMVIRVRDGSVQLAQGEKALVVEAGQALQLSQNTADFSSLAVDDEHWIWADAIDKNFSFDNRSMAEALYWLARKQGWKLEYLTPSDQIRARKEILHGDIQFQSADDLLEQLSIISDMRYQLNDKVLRIFYPEESE